MKKAVACIFALAAGSALAADDWSYQGATGPTHWGGVCAAGTQQSPIDVRTEDVSEAAGHGITLNWTAFAPEVLNKGYTIQAETGGAGGFAVAEGRRYDLVQVHFHHDSEHAIDGRLSPMEAHFVHSGADGDLLVVGVMIEPGAPNPALEAIWALTPPEPGAAKGDAPLDLGPLLPADHDNAYRYKGSLTTPPCSEIVTWHVLAQPVTASPSQIEAFTARIPQNNRPLQAPGRRYVLTTR